MQQAQLMAHSARVSLWGLESVLLLTVLQRQEERVKRMPGGSSV